jgi:16S rRNA (uracil1498-N3)-methyltransferase
MPDAPISSSPRLYIQEPLSPGADIELPPGPLRHVTALRLRQGDEVTLFDGSGPEHPAVLLRVTRDAVVVRVGARRDVDRESPVSIVLALGISAGDRMDYALQKATELGVSRVVPLATERSVVRLGGTRADRRLLHWQGVAAAACEQCGRNRLPEVSPVQDFDEFVAARPPGLKLLLAPEGSRRLRDLERHAEVTLLIGPEGGLSPREREAALAYGFEPLRLGPRVLRTETAPVAAIAALQALWGDV